MKFSRSLLFALFILSVLSYTSCIKKYTCVCKIKYTGTPGLPDSSIKEFEITDSKSKAKTKCSNESGNYTYKNINTVANCDIY